MTKEQATFLKHAHEYCGGEADLREDYSGRGMMSKTTFGIVVPSVALLFADVMEYIKENELPYDDIPEFSTFKQDNMGRDIILY